MRLLVVAVSAAATVAVLTAPLPSGAPATALAGPVVHTLEVSGTGVGMHPAYDASVRRYAATTTADTQAITVTATTSDPDGRVLVDGVAATGPVTLTGLAGGDEVSVIFADSAGREADAVFVLPEHFPALSVPTDQPGLAPGLVGLTLAQFGAGAWEQFSTVVDRHGVPVWVRPNDDGALDLKRQPNGHYSEGRNTTTPGRTGSALVELDERFRPVATHETVGLVNTDGHDSILEADGSRVLLAYEPNAGSGLVDSVIQEVDQHGDVVFQWDSSALATETVTPANPDYAHINSVTIVDDGDDFLASFRNLSAVLLIARRAHDGFDPGDVVWKLGGRDSTFAFLDDPYDGPCAQHTGSRLPNGDVMVFDDGSISGFGSLCVDPDDPDGPTVERPQSRMSVYRLDPVAGTARLVSSYAPPGWFTWFMGSAQYLPATGNTLIGWAAETNALATELGPDGSPVWELVAQPSGNGQTYISYRAQKFDVPDATPPDVRVVTPADGAVLQAGQVVTSVFSCTDQGGSTLQSCGDPGPGSTLDTTPGQHTFAVGASDGAGNITTVVHRYTVPGPPVPPAPPPAPLPGDSTYRPDVLVRAGDGGWQGAHVYGPASAQRVGLRVPVGTRGGGKVAWVNRGDASDRCLLRGVGSGSGLAVRYSFRGRDVTQALTSAGWRSPRAEPGERQVLAVGVRARPGAVPGSRLAVKVTCRSAADPAARDAVTIQVRVTRPPAVARP